MSYFCFQQLFTTKLKGGVADNQDPFRDRVKLIYSVGTFRSRFIIKKIILSTKKHISSRIFNQNRYTNFFWLTLILLVTLLVYIPGLDNEFVNWDDNVYITYNNIIHSLSIDNIKYMFSRSFEGHYHPLTLLSFSIDYHFFKTDPWPYHLINIILHLFNTSLVFIIIRRIFNNLNISVITALLFGLHPLHVESVAWITARKDVLFSLFFLLSVYSYILYLRNEKNKFYIYSLILFILSVLSKGQAVTLTLTIFLIDYLQGRKLLSKRVILEKAPFLFISIIFGVIAIYSQEQTGYSGDSTTFQPLYQRLAYACYALSLYIFKLILPIKLSAYYPYPYTSGSMVPSYVYLSVIPVMVLLAAIIIYYKKARKYIFAVLFFIVNIIIMLKLFPVANYIIADRYVYIPSIGLFVIIALLYNDIIHRKKKLISYAVAFILAYNIFIGYLTIKRVEVWQNSYTLLNDVLSKHPRVVTALNSRGDIKAESGDLQGALSDFNEAIFYNPANSRAYRNRALVKYRLGDYEGSITDYNTVLVINPNDAIAYFNRALSKERINDFKGAISDYSNAIKLYPDFQKAYANRAKVYNITGQFSNSTADLLKALRIGPDHYELYYELGYAEYNLKHFEKSIEALDKSIQKNPDFAGAYLYRGYAGYNKGDFTGAVNDLSIALKSDPANAIALAMRGISKIKSGDKEAGCRDLSAAEKLGLKQATKELEKYCKN